MKYTCPRELYDAAFTQACAIEYPEIDRLEQLAGYAVERSKLEAAARILQCPVKASPPNWQHGRVLYTLARQYIAWAGATPTTFLDIGTAKGFSACVLSWAIADAASTHRLVSIDIVEPDALLPRNSVAECEQLMTVHQFVAPFVAPGVAVEFLGGGSARWLNQADRHIGFAFVDGKHSFEAVSFEAITLDKRQRTGDVIVFDDTQITDVSLATRQLKDYRREGIYLSGARRSYLVAVKC